MSDFIPLSVPSINGNEWKYIKECLDTEWVSSAGRYVEHFERNIAEYTGSKYAIACVNGTAALHASLLIAGVRAGDEVIVPTLTFIAPVNAVRYCNAFPVFMDADEYYNLDSAKTVEFILESTEFRNGCSYNKISGRRVNAIVPVHVFGNPVWLDDLVELCRQRNIRIVEDATESLGTHYVWGKYSGNHTGTLGDLGCLSFNGNKIITSGGGGMILTDDRTFAEKARYYTTQAKDDEVRYVHHEVGYNYRMSNIQAALGVAQMEKLPEYLSAKRKNYLRYKEKIGKIAGLRVADAPPYGNSNHWMYAIQIDKALYGNDREGVMAILSGQNIQSRPPWQLNHLQKPYSGSQAYKIELAGDLIDKTLNIPCSVGLKEHEIDRVVDVLSHAHD